MQEEELSDQKNLNMSTLRVVLYQEKLCGEVDPQDIPVIRNFSPDFFVLPEHFFTKDAKDFASVAGYAQENRDYLLSLSKKISCAVIGGSIIEQESDELYNVCYIADEGVFKGRYVKCNPSREEAKQGVLPGAEMKLYSVKGASIGILICGDVLDEHNFHTMGELLPDIVFVPAVSPYKKETEDEKFARDENIFVQGAENSRSYVIKVCGVGSIFGHPIQGRSLVAAPWGIITRVSSAEENLKHILAVELDLEKLWAYQRSYTVR